MTLTLLGWRRTVAALYADARAAAAAGDPAGGWARWRAGRDRLFAEHADSPVDRRSFAGLRYAPYDPGLRFDLPVGPAPSVRIDVPTATDGVVPFSRLGRVLLPRLGTLDVWWLESYGGGVFLPFRDATCGATAYGGGRYLVDTVKGADLGGDDGRLVVDLNFAYNPSCAYDPEWACPLPPAGNVLDVPVHAGELLPG